jgi:hypothetical protein
MNPYYSGYPYYTFSGPGYSVPVDPGAFSIGQPYYGVGVYPPSYSYPPGPVGFGVFYSF